MGTDEDYFYGRPNGPPDVLVIHTMAGYLAGTDSTFNDVSRDASTHYGISLDGRIHQYVRLEDCAWGNGVLEAGQRWTGHYGRPGVSPNYRTVSIETEDRATPATTPVSDALYAATLALAKHVILPRYPSIRSVTGHHVISPQSRPGCPGRRWTDGRIQALAQELGLELFI